MLTNTMNTINTLNVRTLGFKIEITNPRYAQLILDKEVGATEEEIEVKRAERKEAKETAELANLAKRISSKIVKDFRRNISKADRGEITNKAPQNIANYKAYKQSIAEYALNCFMDAIANIKGGDAIDSNKSIESGGEVTNNNSLEAICDNRGTVVNESEVAKEANERSNKGGIVMNIQLLAARPSVNNNKGGDNMDKENRRKELEKAKALRLEQLSKASREGAFIKANSVLENDKAVRVMAEDPDEVFLRNYRNNRDVAKRFSESMWKVIPIIREYFYNSKEKAWSYRYKVTSYSPMIQLVEPYAGDDIKKLKVFGSEVALGERYKYYDSVISVRTPGNTRKMLSLSQRGFYLMQNTRNKIFTVDRFNKLHARNGADREAMASAEFFKAACWGPSGEKKGSKYFFRTENSQEAIMEMFRKLDRLTGHAFEDEFVKEQKPQKILKNMSRWGNYSTNMKVAYKIDLSKDYIVYVDRPRGVEYAAPDFDSKTLDRLAKHGIDFGTNINDGKNYINASSLGKTVADELDMPITKAIKIVRRWAVQSRTDYANTKCQSEVLYNSEMDHQYAMFQELYPDSCVIYGNPKGQCQMIVDDDGAKLFAEIEGYEVMTVWLMAIAASSESATSGQLLAKCLTKDYDRTIELAKELLTEKLNYEFKGNLVDSTSHRKKGAINNIAACIDSRTGFYDFYLMKGVTINLAAMAKKAWTRDKIAMESIYNHAMFDDAWAMTGGRVKRVLTLKDVKGRPCVEAFSYDVIAKYNKEIAEIEDSEEMTAKEKEAALDELLTAVIIKYPSAGVEEFLAVRYLTLKEYTDRVDSALIEMPIMEREIVKGRYMRLAYGVTLFAGYNFIKQKLAGMDVDYDGTVAMFHELKWVLYNDAATPDIITFIDYFDESAADYSIFDAQDAEYEDEEINLADEEI